MAVIDTLEKYKGKTWTVELSDGETFYINEDTVFDFSLKKGQEITEERLEEVKTADLFRKARERALYLLDYRDYSFTELYKKLEGTYTEEISLEVMRRLAESGLINDRRYAETLARKYMVTKKFGYYRARQEMIMKGLDRDIVEQALLVYEDDTLERLEELVESKYARKITDGKSLEKVKNALVRQGYSYSDINAVLSEYETED